MTGSLAYRKNEEAILAGHVPEKYLRLLPFISGDRILEAGSAEGVLSLLLARAGRMVTALERSRERHDAALALADRWAPRFPFKPGGEVNFVHGSIEEAVTLVQPGVFDTFLAVRMIYYLGAELDRVFAGLAETIPNVVLCGNRNRASWWEQGIPDKEGGPANYYASAAGMEDLLVRHGFEIVNVVADGDPIVIGRKGV